MYRKPPGTDLYEPLYAPWNDPEFRRVADVARPRTLVTPDRLYVLERLLRQTLALPGEVMECGVYRGGTAALLARLVEEAGADKRLYLFDTFAGMPAADAERDRHREGDFADTSLEAVRAFVGAAGRCDFRPGRIPETFAGLDALTLAFCHVDLDLYRAILDTCAFAWPRLAVGGAMVFDDYGFPSCPGAREAVDEFFADKDAFPLCLQTGQAIVYKTPAALGG